MRRLIKKLAELSDQLDASGGIKLADKIDELIQEVSRRSKEEDNYLTICPECDGDGFTDETPFCPLCKGEGFVKEAGIKLSFVRRRGNKWVVLSHKGKTLGTYNTKEEANKRLREIEFFKHQ